MPFRLTAEQVWVTRHYLVHLLLTIIHLLLYRFNLVYAIIFQRTSCSLAPYCLYFIFIFFSLQTPRVQKLYSTLPSPPTHTIQIFKFSFTGVKET